MCFASELRLVQEPSRSVPSHTQLRDYPEASPSWMRGLWSATRVLFGEQHGNTTSTARPLR